MWLSCCPVGAFEGGMTSVPCHFITPGEELGQMSRVGVATNRKSAHRRLFFNHVRPSIENARLLMMAARAMDLCCARLRGCTK